MTKDYLSGIRKALSSITNSRERIGGRWPFEFEFDSPSRTIVDITTNSLDDVKEIGGLLSYNGQQITLHIVNPRNTESQIPEIGPRFHVSYCSTLIQMEEDGRYNRYGISNSHDDWFTVHPMHKITRRYGKKISAKLHVCQNCLDKLNYENHAETKSYMIVKNFSVKKFFEEGHSFFRELPKYRTREFPDGNYPKNWSSISTNFREKKDWHCECCHVQLEHKRQYLHTHHIDGEKSHCRDSNLMALCLLCHAKKPRHGHMKIRLHEQQEMQAIRAEQDLPTTCPVCSS